MKTPEQIVAEIDMPPSFFRLPIVEQLEAVAAAAIKADRAQLRTLAAEAHDVIGQIEDSREAGGLDDVLYARDAADDALHRLVAYARGRA